MEYGILYSLINDLYLHPIQVLYRYPMKYLLFLVAKLVEEIKKYQNAIFLINKKMELFSIFIRDPNYIIKLVFKMHISTMELS